MSDQYTIKRYMKKILLQNSQQYPVVTLMGPRQSGKTTLVREVFRDKPYVSLEDPDVRLRSKEDPRGFLAQYPQGAILDEIQQQPELLSYIQTIVDQTNQPNQFVVTGSQNFKLMESVTQSLAGRTSLLKLLPLSLSELGNPQDVDDLLLKGFYPRVHRDLSRPTRMYANYFETYVQRDLQLISQIHDIYLFQKFVKLCAGRIGQLFEASQLASEVGVSVSTIKNWIGILEKSFIVFLLQPYASNIKKRLIKTPKIYFYDVGLASYLLEITDIIQMKNHPSRGHLFENMLIVEVLKTAYNNDVDANIYFYRDQHKNEVDLVISNGQWLVPVEIKSAQTFHKDFVKGIEVFKKVFSDKVHEGYVIYGGEEEFRFKNWQVMSLQNTSNVFLPTLKKGGVYRFEDANELASFFDRLDCSVADRERFVIKHYLRALDGKGIWEYPLTLVKRERPDFLLNNMGIEVVEATTEEYQKQLNEESRQNLGEFVAISENGFVGDEPEQKSAELMMSEILKKVIKLNRAGPSWSGSPKELLIYDGTPFSIVTDLKKVGELLSRLYQEFKEEGSYDYYFDRISIINDKEVLYHLNMLVPM